MTSTDRTDGIAAIIAARPIADTLAERLDDVIRVYQDQEDPSNCWVDIDHDDALTLAGHIVAGFTAHLEHRDGLRHVVLTGSWEVDPAAVRNTARPDAARVAEAAVAILSA